MCNFNVSGQSLPLSADSKWDYLKKDIEFCNIKDNQIQVLIGADVPAALISSEIRKGSSNCELLPYVSKTPFGWTLFGVCDSSISFRNAMSINFTFFKKREISDFLQDFW